MNRPRAGAPPGNESRPWQGGNRDITDATSVTDARDRIRALDGFDLPPHRPGARRADSVRVEERYRASVHFWQRRGWCSHPTRPSTFGLNLDELCREAHRLIQAGWTPEEIRLVLDMTGGRRDR